MRAQFKTISRRALLGALPVIVSACETNSAPQAGSIDPLVDFPTAPLSPPFADTPVKLLALSSCSDETRAMMLYPEILLQKPDGLVMLGDNVYGSSTPEDPQLSDLRAAYFQMARRSEFRAVVSGVPTVAVWDDHDFGKNDAGGDFVHKALAQRMFNAFWNIGPQDELRRRPGIYRTFMLGPVGRRVQLIILDTRYFRDPLRLTDQRGVAGRERYIPHPDDSSADILGPQQWQWLEEQLRQPADLRIIASSIQVVADGHGWERWGQFPAARRRLYDLIGSTGAKGVVFVSGDRHLGAINRVQPAGLYPLFDLTASAINTSSWRPGESTDNTEAGPYRLGPSYTPPNFGLVRIDWDKRSVGFEIMGAAGFLAQRVSVDFTELGLPT
jgi:alkaline phosphatase D